MNSPVQFENLLYGSNQVSVLLDELIPLSREKNAKGVDVKIKYDPGDLSRIWVLHPVSKTYIEFPCLQIRYSQGLTLHHHLQIRKNAALEHRKLHSEEDLCAAREALRLKVEAAFGSKLMRERKRAARIKLVQNNRYAREVIQIYDETQSSLSTLEQSVSETTQNAEFISNLSDNATATFIADEDTLETDAASTSSKKASQRRGRQPGGDDDIASPKDSPLATAVKIAPTDGGASPTQYSVPIAPNKTSTWVPRR